MENRQNAIAESWIGGAWLDAYDEVIEEFLLGDVIRGFVAVLDQQAHGTSIDLPTSLAQAAYLHGFVELYVPLALEPGILFHFPLLFRMRVGRKKRLHNSLRMGRGI